MERGLGMFQLIPNETYSPSLIKIAQITELNSNKKTSDLSDYILLNTEPFNLRDGLYIAFVNIQHNPKDDYTNILFIKINHHIYNELL